MYPYRLCIDESIGRFAEKTNAFFRVAFVHVYLSFDMRHIHAIKCDRGSEEFSVCVCVELSFFFSSTLAFSVIGIKCILNVSFGSICVLTMIRWYPKRIAY